jgi:predicted nucleic acid-binding protein
MQGAVVPAIWPLEIANVLVQADRNKALAVPFEKVMAAMWNLPVEVDPVDIQRVWSTVATLARRHLLSAYDAAYLELAVSAGIGLATLDKALGKAARLEGIPVTGV